MSRDDSGRSPRARTTRAEPIALAIRDHAVELHARRDVEIGGERLKPAPGRSLPEDD
jgi:hypothetical protein